MSGEARRRLEDWRLLTGRGAYLDDLTPPGTLYAAFVRSPVAHGVVTDVDVAEAARMSGVVGVFRAADLGLDRRMPNMHPAADLAASVQGYPLAVEEVCYVGEPVAVVVAADRYIAADAASAVMVDYDLLPACVDYRRALDSAAPPVHRGSGSNLVGSAQAAYGDVDRAFAHADHVLPVELSQHRGAAAFIEARGVLAASDDGQMTMWSSTQSPHRVRDLVAGYLGIDPMRVVAPDVGGGFGPKASAYSEEYVVPALARHLRAPVKWVETRRESFLATNQQRDQAHSLEVAAAQDGTILGLRGRTLLDNGAYVPYGLLLALTGLNLIPGPYVIEALDVTVDVVYTNLVPTSPIRGAGRPVAVFAMERCVDAVARRLGLDPVEVRRRNLIPASEGAFTRPLRTRAGDPVSYDGGDYAALLDAAVARADWPGFERRRKAGRRRGLRPGIGLASYVEDTGIGPAEGARVTVGDDGAVTARVGVASQGQGHATVFAQLVARQLGVDPDEVTVVAGDTREYPAGVATVASRTAVAAGPAVHAAAVTVADRVRIAAADLLEADAHDLVLEGGAVNVAGQPGSGVTLGEVAAHAATIGMDLEADVTVPFSRSAYAFGTHVAEVEVDPETGTVDVTGYTVAHDCGTMLNPMIVEGQIHGGVAHGLGNALSERVVSSDDGQPLVTTFLDYRIPSAVQVPLVGLVHTQTPSPTNELGVRGAGEGGTIPAMAAVAAAVENALADLGVVVDRYPLDPQTVMQLIRQAGPRPGDDA